ncbi:tRNA (guanosine(46)-N7)-methyltransferase TrmB [Marinicella rhabdoformis]|uniref:tRNA (guanosine(46)-N7)-methyltransferase TrmB n=1 Tax=Marinicella rhabdoformis TaxID=2580566 RepID=UPI0012AED622|nr:tRNA (guanosine(46)-N7)-methyltransferase TrmB [Marinicella rhabdoformis]
MQFDSKERQIRSFVLRKGKMTTGQRKAVEELLPQYAIDPVPKQLNFHTIFGNDNPVWLDIGFGNGESIIHAAQIYPDVNFLGIEVHLPGVGHLLIESEKLGLNNVKIIRNDAVDMMTKHMSNDSLDAVHVYFPDPWHKKRHHKRRIINPEFLALTTDKLKTGGRLHYASDWEPYAIEVKELLSVTNTFKNTQADGGFSDRPEWRPVTKFERRGQKLNHGSYDLIVHKI